MERPEKCPSCLSKYQDIRGRIYIEGEGPAGRTCGDTWHRGPDYPDQLELTHEDRAFLKAQNIGLDD